jgi:hypothetical protein
MAEQGKPVEKIVEEMTSLPEILRHNGNNIISPSVTPGRESGASLGK